MPHTPHEDQPLHVIVTEEFAEVLKSRHEARNAKSIAEGHGPVEDTSPFITRAELEKKKALRHTEKLPRGRITHAARLKIAVRTKSDPAFARHARKCAVCRHPEVERIEDFFVNWSSSAAICKIFKINGVDAVYRHARATGLDVARRQNARFALEKMIEEVDRVHVTSSSVVRAVRALSCIDEKGHWTDPPSTHIVLTAKDMPQQNLASTPTELPGQAAHPVSTTDPPAGFPEGTGGSAVFTDSLATRLPRALAKGRSLVLSSSAEADEAEAPPPLAQAVPWRAEACSPGRALAKAANRLIYEELEVDVTHTKEDADADSNR